VVVQTSRGSVAILELTGVHEEIIPSLVDALPRGMSAVVYVNDRCRLVRGDIFAELAGLNALVEYVEISKAIDWVNLGRRIDAGGHEALIVTTFQIEGVALWARGRKLPVLGVIHNPPLFLNSAACKSALADEGLRSIVLAPHVAARFNTLTQGAHMDAIGVVEPVFWGEGERGQPPAGAPKRVIVPGGVNFVARDFEGLLRALDHGRLSRLRQSGIELQIIGGGPDRAKLEDQVNANDLADVVCLLPLSETGRVPYSAYVAALREAWAIYPLLPLKWPPYRDYKITSAIPTAIGFGLPLVLDRWTASAYRVPALVTDGSIGAALDGLISLTPPERSALVDEIVTYGRSARNRNRTELGRLLSASRTVAMGIAE
jgi:hypothetical protein